MISAKREETRARRLAELIRDSAANRRIKPLTEYKSARTRKAASTRKRA